jgi:4-amino-4-deoxy-L-arabinose transferase-like glycosyltransferase
MQNRYIQLAILALITLIFGWASLAYPFGPDQGVFAQIGRTILQGGLPIRDAFDVKPPVIYLLYALAEGMFGPNLWSIRVLDLLAVFLTSTCLLNIFKDRRQGLTAAALYPVVYFICFSYPDTAQTESFSNLFLAAAVVLLIRQDQQTRLCAALAGAAASLAILTKTTNVLLTIPLLVMAFRASPKLHWPFLIGGLVPVAGMFLWYWAHGSVGTIFEMYAFQSEYGGKNFSSMGGFFVDAFLLYFKPFTALTLLIILGCVLTWPMIRSKEPERAVAATWFLVALITVLLQMRFYGYHFVLIAPGVCCLFAVTCSPDRTKLDPRLRLLVPLTVFALALVNIKPLVLTTRLLTGGIGQADFGEKITHPVWYSVPNTFGVVDWINENGYSGTPLTSTRSIRRSIGWQT